jgi:nucleoid DNA-binding protein
MIDKQRRDEMPNKRMSKSQFVTTLAEKSGLNKRQAMSALDTINVIVAQQLGKRGPGEVLIPGLLKLNVVDKPATRKHEGINPFTKEPMTYKAKAARKVIKVRPLKALKDTI